MEFTKQRLPLIVGGASLVIFFVTYLFLFQPLVHQLKVQASECSRTEAEVAEARSHAFIFKDRPLKKSLITESEATVAINELTRRGNLKGVEFVLLTPKKIEKPAGQAFRILPIETEIKSTYENLGNFLGSLDEMEKSLITVGSFTASLDPEEVSKVRTHLTLYLYLAE